MLKDYDKEKFLIADLLSEIYIPSTVKKAYSPVGYKYECPKQKLHIYIEKSDEKNYEKWLPSVEEFDITFIEKSEIFE